MKIWPASLLGCLLPFIWTGPAKCEWAYVSRVYDGDTFLTAGGTRVRILDIDTPETHHPVIGREPGGEEATRLARHYLEGERVWLDGRAQDKYGRRLAMVRLPNGRIYADIVRSMGLDKRSASGRMDAGSAQMNVEKHAFRKTGRIWVRAYFRKNGRWVSGHWRR